MPWGVTAAAVYQGYTANKAGKYQESKAKDAADLAYRTSQENAARLSPYADAGKNAAGQIGDNWDYFNHQFNAHDLEKGLAPNYNFMLKQGQDAATNAMNLNGGLGGNFAQGLNQFTQNYAQNAYQQAYENYQGQRSGIFDRLNTIANLGENAAAGQGAFMQHGADQWGDYTTQGANARAAGWVQQAKSYGQAGSMLGMYFASPTGTSMADSVGTGGMGVEQYNKAYQNTGNNYGGNGAKVGNVGINW